MAIGTCLAPAEYEELVERLDLLNDQLRILQDIASDIREDLEWALENGNVQLILAGPDSNEDSREATTGTDAVTLAIRLNVALGQLRDGMMAAIRSRSEGETEFEVTSSASEEAPVNDPATSELTSIELFEVGDAVEFEGEGEVWFGEIADLDDAQNAAIVQLIPSFEEVDVPQDLLRRITPDELTRRHDEWDQASGREDEVSFANKRPSFGDRVCLNVHGHELEGEVNAVHRATRTVDVVLTPSMETVTVDWSDLIPVLSQSDGSSSVLQHQIEPLSDRMAEHERWCHEVRDPAEKHSEGRRVVMPANGRALLEYQVAPLPNGEWAVRWAHRFLCGDVRGAGHPWTTRATRDDCLELVLQTSRKMFSAKTIDKVQIPVAREMLHLLGDGLFGFTEPEPEHSDTLDHSGLAAAAEVAALQFQADSP